MAFSWNKKQKIDFNNPEIQENIEKYLGQQKDTLFHAVVPFEMGYDAGGAADVYVYKEKLDGVTYVTGDLMGKRQKKSDAGNYELMICHKQDDEWGAKLISQLSYYTVSASLNSGETMDAGPFTKEDIVALIFDKYCDFKVNGDKYGLLLIMGITEAELAWSEKHGGLELIRKLKEERLYPFTEFNRNSVV